VSIMFSWRFRWSGVQAIYSLIAQGIVRRRQGYPTGSAQLMLEQVRQVADDLVTAIRIWQVEDCLEIKAHIACWHRCLHTYRGYVLCSDTTERTFLIDTRTWTYIAIAKACLLQIDGVNQAKTFVDALCDVQERGGS
jgi:hypothetical protein